MTKTLRFKWVMSAVVTLVFSAYAVGQKLPSTLAINPAQRIQAAPESVFKSFREAGMKPLNHPLTPAEKAKVDKAFAHLTPLHQRILKRHLHSISFMDNMPNTALTSPVELGGATQLFNITFRASLLNENISQWATWKENTCFQQEADSSYSVRVEAGTMEALVYVLMHEATHVVDAVRNLTPHPAQASAVVPPTPFTKDVWRLMNKPAAPYADSLLEQTRFRSGKPLPIRRAPEVYARLAKTPFPSLYAMAAWSEDIAELLTIYHLTSNLKQPFTIIVTKNKVELARFEPMKQELVKQRLQQLTPFYAP